MVRVTIKNGKFPALTKAQEQQLEMAKSLPFVYDEECPPQTAEELKLFRKANERKLTG